RLEALDERPGDVFGDPLVPLFDRVDVGVALVGAAQDGAAQVRDAAHGVAIETNDAVGVVLDEPLVAVLDAPDLPAAHARAQYDRADHRVQPRGVAAARIHRNFSYH